MESNQEYVPKLLRVPTDQLPTKRQLPEYVKGMVEDMIESGTMDIAEVFARLKFINETTAAAMKNPAMISAVMDVIDLDDRKEAEYFGRMKLSKSSTGTQYDYGFDDRWKGLQDDLEAAEKETARIKELIKQREEFLQAVAKNPHDVFDDDGVLIHKAAVKKPSRSILVARF